MEYIWFKQIEYDAENVYFVLKIKEYNLGVLYYETDEIKLQKL